MPLKSQIYTVLDKLKIKILAIVCTIHSSYVELIRIYMRTKCVPANLRHMQSVLIVMLFRFIFTSLSLKWPSLLEFYRYLLGYLLNKPEKYMKVTTC